MLPSICPSEFLVGGMKEPSMYMHCRGWDVVVLGGLWGCGGVYENGRVGSGAVFPCVGEFDVTLCVERMIINHSTILHVFPR